MRKQGLLRLSGRRALLALAVSVAVTCGAQAGPYEDGMEAYERGDFAAALPLLRPFAESGRPEAQFVVGFFLLSGRAGPQDEPEGFRLIRSAAMQGHPGAMSGVGALYFSGRGTPQDSTQAYMWVSLAAERYPPGPDRDRAARNRDMLAGRLTPAQIAEAQRLAREWDAAHPAR